jgi:iron-sulfur cluster repair protein YtfE (RIC family)
MENATILTLMISHHALLDALYVLFHGQETDKSQGVETSLSELSWETKKHFFAEETAIFDHLPLKNIEIWNIINRLRDEHLQMVNMLNKFTEDSPNVSEKEMEEFHNLMNSHREVEEKELYPRLDKELSDEQKRIIVSRINEIPLRK